MKIGYQGIEDSDSHNTALLFIEKHGIRNVKLIPLISSKYVVENLRSNAIDLGICATEKTQQERYMKHKKL